MKQEVFDSLVHGIRTKRYVHISGLMHTADGFSIAGALFDLFMESTKVGSGWVCDKRNPDVLIPKLPNEFGTYVHTWLNWMGITMIELGEILTLSDSVGYSGTIKWLTVKYKLAYPVWYDDVEILAAFHREADKDL